MLSTVFFVKKLILISLLILTIGFATWLILRPDYKNANNTPNQTNQTTTSSEGSDVKSSQADYQGQEVVSHNDKFRITIPNGWKPVTKCTDSDTLFVKETRDAEMAYNEQVKPEIMEMTCGTDAPSLFFVTRNNKSQAQPEDGDSEPFVTSSGIEGTRICEKNETVIGISERTYLQTCNYRFEVNDSVYTVSYSRPDESYADRTALIDRVVKSIVVQ